FFISSRRRHTRSKRDWSSDVCSSDLKNELVDRYQRQSKEFKQSIALELIHGKSFKDVADRFHTSTSTVIRRFDTINADMLKEPKQLPSVIAIDEYKGDA